VKRINSSALERVLEALPEPHARYAWVAAAVGAVVVWVVGVRWRSVQSRDREHGSDNKRRVGAY
jgi:hypothetical protein